MTSRDVSVNGDKSSASRLRLLKTAEFVFEARRGRNRLNDIVSSGAEFSRSLLNPCNWSGTC